MPTRKPTKYEGKLGKPLSPLPEAAHPAFGSSASAAKLVAAQMTEVSKRLYLLFKHYQIDPKDTDRWYRLACRLAFDNVPGFKVEKRGKSLEWGFLKVRKLQKDVRSYTVRGYSELEACKTLAKLKAYRDVQAKDSEACGKSLYRRFMEDRDNLDGLDQMKDKEREAGNRPTPVLAMPREDTHFPITGKAAYTIIKKLAHRDAAMEEARTAREIEKHLKAGSIKIN